MTKVLLVTSRDDFGATAFENAFGGTKVADIIADLDTYKAPPEEDEETNEEGEWNLEVKEFEGTIDPKFAKFIKSRIQDYDQSKNTTFYLDTETV